MQTDPFSKTGSISEVSFWGDNHLYNQVQKLVELQEQANEMQRQHLGENPKRDSGLKDGIYSDAVGRDCWALLELSQ